MNLNVLPTSVMIAITGKWLRDPALVREMLKRALGASIWKEIEAAYALIVERSRARMSIEAEVAQLVKLITRLDGIHDDRARVLYHLLLALADATRDAELAEFLRRVHALMFPHALRIVHMSYLAEAGEVAELEARMTPDILARLETVRVADQSLADIYREWVEAGKELGYKAQERTNLEASLGIQGTTAPQTSIRKVRGRWLRAVRLLIDALEFLDLPDDVRERLLAPLEQGISTALARRSAGNPDVDDNIDGDIDSDVDGDIVSEPVPVAPAPVLAVSEPAVSKPAAPESAASGPAASGSELDGDDSELSA